MRLLITTDVFSFSPAGGAGTVLFETARRLVRRGYECIVVCRRRRDLPDDGVVEGIHFLTYAVPDGQEDRLFWEGWKGTRRLAAIAAERDRFDAVWFHHPFPGEVLRRHAPFAALPWVYTFHSPWHVEYLIRRHPPGVAEEPLTPGASTDAFPLTLRVRGALRRFVEARTLARCARVVTLSRHMGEVLRAWHPVPPEAQVVIPGGADIVQFAPEPDAAGTRARWGVPAGAPCVGTLGYFIPRKGIREFVEAAVILRRIFSNLHAVIGGTGPLDPEIRAWVERSGWSSFIHLTGFVPWKELPAFYRGLDLFMLPSQELEGFGLVLCEALASGTPACGTRIGGVPEVLEPLDRRCIADSPRPADLAKCMEYWLSDRLILDSIRVRCRPYAVEFLNWERHATRMDELFRAVVPEHAHP